ncbi:hypothetical protein H7F33_10235 [Pedobacter sp. PAMC26386]|nr:hypothetical protein H7F33_10235 [Pedobacter sp. PAMC26386]
MKDAKAWLENTDPKIMLGDRWNSLIFQADGNGGNVIKVKVNESLKDNIWTLRDILLQRDDTGSIEAFGYEVQVANSYFTTKRGAELSGANKREFIDNADFTGKVFLYTLKNKVVKGMRFLNGKLVSSLVLAAHRTDITTMGQQGLEQEPDCSFGSFDSSTKSCTPSGTTLSEVEIHSYVPPPNFNWVFPPSNPASEAAPPPAGSVDLPIGNTGAGGGNGNRELKTDSLKAKFPCADKLILQPIFKSAAMNDFVQPFLTNMKPTITYNTSNDLPWGSTTTGGLFELGHTGYDPNSGLHQSSIVTLNEKMLNNSSQLLVAATTIHETLHAYINYNIATSVKAGKDAYNDHGNWLLSLDGFYLMNDMPANYTQHSLMLADYFDKAVSALSYWDSNQTLKHTSKEIAMAMMYGLTTAESSCSQSDINKINATFDALKLKYSITTSDLNTFNVSQLNSPNSLPKSGCN